MRGCCGEVWLPRAEAGLRCAVVVERTRWRTNAAEAACVHEVAERQPTHQGRENELPVPAQHASCEVRGRARAHVPLMAHAQRDLPG